MNTTITKRELITHELKWYWKKPELRKEIHQWSEFGAIEHAPASAILPDLTAEQLEALLALDADAWTCRAMVGYAISELHSVYRYIFMGDDTHAIQLEISPLTCKLGRYVLPYVGVMAVFAIADRLIAAYQSGRLEMSADADLWLRQMRFMSARRLHVFTKNLTRLNVDNVPTYGVCVTSQHVAQFYLRETGVTDAIVALAEQTYPGRLENHHLTANVLPTRIEFRPVWVSLPELVAET